VVIRLQGMMMLSWVRHLWAAVSPLWFVPAVGLAGFAPGLVGIVHRFQRHIETRMILREAPGGSRVVLLTRRGTSATACIVDVAARPSVPVLPPAREAPAV
jgi:hypothetical protein